MFVVVLVVVVLVVSLVCFNQTMEVAPESLEADIKSIQNRCPTCGHVSYMWEMFQDRKKNLKAHIYVANTYGLQVCEVCRNQF